MSASSFNPINQPTTTERAVFAEGEQTRNHRPTILGLIKRVNIRPLVQGNDFTPLNFIQSVGVNLPQRSKRRMENKFINVRVTSDAQLLQFVDHTGLPSVVQTRFELGTSASASLMRLVHENSAHGMTPSHLEATGIVQHLTSCIGFFAVTGELPWQVITGGREPSFGSLETAINSRALHNGSSLYIPTNVQSKYSPATFWILIGCCAFFGTRVITNAVELSSQTGAARIFTYSDGEAARGCVEALMFLGGVFAEAGKLALFSYAFTRGLHAPISVHGHSDEGGIFRDMLRSGSFATPYGSLPGEATPLGGLLLPGGTDHMTIASWYYSWAFTTAALVAHCSPTTLFNGAHHIVVVDGVNQAARVRNICFLLPEFLETYLTCLCTYFGSVDDVRLPTSHMVAAVRSDNRLHQDNRHLAREVLAPFFWIEPTGWIHPAVPTTPMEAAGLGSFARALSSSEMPLTRNGHLLEQEDTFSSTMRFSYSSARSTGFIAALHRAPTNGLGAVVISQCAPSDLSCALNSAIRRRHVVMQDGEEVDGFIDGEGNVFEEDDVAQDRAVLDRNEATTARLLTRGKLTLKNTIWSTPDNPFPHPTSGLHVGGDISIVIQHLGLATVAEARHYRTPIYGEQEPIYYDDNGNQAAGANHTDRGNIADPLITDLRQMYVHMHIPTASELINGKVTFTTSVWLPSVQDNNIMPEPTKRRLSRADCALAFAVRSSQGVNTFATNPDRFKATRLAGPVSTQTDRPPVELAPSNTVNAEPPLGDLHPQGAVFDGGPRIPVTLTHGGQKAPKQVHQRGVNENRGVELVQAGGNARNVAPPPDLAPNNNGGLVLQHDEVHVPQLARIGNVADVQGF